MRKQNMKKSETTEQIMLFQWAEREKGIVPALALMYHVPNEGKRSNGGILKAAGLKKGVPDVCLPVPSGGFHALYIEMKHGKNKTSYAQEEYMKLLRQQGNETAVCYSAQDAKNRILDYLSLDRPGKMHLSECIKAPWIDGKCDGIPMPGKMFARKECRGCAEHRPTKAEKTLDVLMAAVQGNFKRPIMETIIDLSAGKGIGPGYTAEDTLEAVNKNLALLVKGNELDVKQSAAILSIATEAYNTGKGGRENG